MAKCACNCSVTCFAVLFAIFLALDVIFLGATVGLAWYGIEEADNENSCRFSNATEDCVPISNLVAAARNSTPVAEPLFGQILNFNYDLYLYWMASATVCGLVWACINAITIIVLNELIRTHLVFLSKLEKEVVDGVHELVDLAHKKSERALELVDLAHKELDGEHEIVDVAHKGSGGAHEIVDLAQKELGGAHEIVDLAHKEYKELSGAQSASAKPQTTAAKGSGEAQPTPKDKPKLESDEFKDPNNNIDGFTDQIGAVRDHEWLHKPLRHFGPLSMLSLFLSSICFACALLCLVWGIAISFNHARQDAKTVATFIIVEVLVAVGVPVFLCAAVALFAVVLEYITIGHLDMRTLVPRFISMVKFESGVKYDYWVIDEIFYYPLKRKDGRSDKGCWFSVDKSPATWFLAIIIGTAINLVISYFVDLTLDAQITVTSCDDPLIDRTYDCFTAGNLTFIDCVDNRSATLLHCFKFYRFGVETNIITAITTSYAFYLVTIAVFKQIFSVVRTLIHIKPSRFWGIGFLAIGLIFYGASVIVLVIWIRGYAAAAIAEIRRINVIHIWQFFMVSTFVTTMGGLLLSKWYEKLHTKVHAKVIETPLVHYSDTQRKNLHAIEASETWPPRLKSPPPEQSDNQYSQIN